MEGQFNKYFNVKAEHKNFFLFNVGDLFDIC